MKKFLLIVTLLLISCTKDDSMETPQPTAGSITFEIFNQFTYTENGKYQKVNNSEFYNPFSQRVNGTAFLLSFGSFENTDVYNYMVSNGKHFLEYKNNGKISETVTQNLIYSNGYVNGTITGAKCKITLNNVKCDDVSTLNGVVIE